MSMTIEMPGAFQDSGPRPAWVMTEEHPLAVVGDFQLARWRLLPCKRSDDGMNLVRRLVIVVAENQKLATHEAREESTHAVAVVKTHGKITQMIDDIVWSHDAVPSADQEFIHVADVGERAVAGCRRQHQVVRKMRVRRVVYCRAGQECFL